MTSAAPLMVLELPSLATFALQAPVVNGDAVPEFGSIAQGFHAWTISCSIGKVGYMPGGLLVWIVGVSASDAGSQMTAAAIACNIKLLTKAQSLINRVLDGRGMLDQQREFRNNRCLFRHRAVSPADLEEASDDIRNGLKYDPLAGPITNYWTEGIPNGPQLHPCEHPGRHVPPHITPEFWIPQDCGYCGPCQARIDIDRRSKL